MMNFKKFFYPNYRVVSVSKAQKDILECFFTNKEAFSEWFCFKQETKIRFQFYYPIAIDFYFDDFKLFTAYFKRNHADQVELQELKMTEDNYRSIRNTTWKPFEEVMLQFLTNLDKNHKVTLFQKEKALYEYNDICKGSTTAAPVEQHPVLNPQVPSQVFQK